MDYRHRALYYLVGTRSDGLASAENADTLVSRGFKPELLSDYNSREARFIITAERWVADAAVSFLRESHKPIPIDTLLARVDKKAPPELREQARALVQGLRSQTGDGEDLGEIIEGLFADHKRRMQHQMLVRVKNDVLVQNADPEKGVTIIREFLQQIEDLDGSDGSYVYTLGQTAAEHAMDYQQREMDPEAGIGIPTGLTPFDAATGGVQRGEVAIVVGKTGGGKSTLVGSCTANSYLLGRNVGYAGKEMLGSVVRRRIEAGLLNAVVANGVISRKHTHVPGGAARALETGSLTPEMKTRFLEMQQLFTDEEESGHRFWVIEPQSYRTINDLQLVIRRLKSEGELDLLSVDSLNIQSMVSPAEREDLRQGAMVELLREIAQEHNLAILVDSQERPATWTRRFVDLSEVMMFSQSISQRADHILRLYSPPAHPKLKEVQPLKARNSQLVESFCLHWYQEDLILELAPRNMLNENSAPPPDARATVAAATTPKADDEL